MAEYLIQDTTLTSIADAIRSKTGESGEIKLTDFSTKIQNITSGGSGVGKLTGMLLVGEKNGKYYPNQSICFDTIYPFKASYTQEFLAPLYEEASAVFEFPMNDFATGAFLIDNNDEGGNALAIIRFMLGADIYYYGLMKECSEPKFWVPVEVATALGYSAESWYSIVDESTMTFTPSDIPDYPLMGSATYVLDSVEEIFKLFDPSDFVGFSSVKVDMSTVPEGYIKPTGTVQITKNGTVDVSTYEKAEVNVPTGGGTETVLTALSVTENGTYAPKKFDPHPSESTNYLLKTSYTQESLSALYAEASAVFGFPMNEIATGAFLIDNGDEEGNALAVVCFMLGETSFYGLMKACSEPKFWVPVEVATALGQSAEGWYSLVDESTMTFAPSDVPEYPIVDGAIYTVGMDDIALLFECDDFDGYSSVKVNVQPKLTPLTAEENGTYAPKDSFNPWNGTYKFLSSYTQEYLSFLHGEASANGTFAMNLYMEAANIVDNSDGTRLLSVCYSLDGNSYYFLMYDEDAESEKTWAPAEVATAFGLGGEGWYTSTETSSTLSDAPEFTAYADTTYHIDHYKLGPLFAYDEFNGYSSVKVNVQPKLAPLTATANGEYYAPYGIDGYHWVTVNVPTEGGGTLTPKIASGKFTPTSMSEGVTVEHNLGVMPDIVILQVRAYINADAIPSYAGCTTAATGVCKEIGDLTGRYQYIQMFADNTGQWLQADILAPMEENGYGAVIRNASTSTVTFGGNGVRLITDGNGVADDLYYWTVIGGIVQR